VWQSAPAAFRHVARDGRISIALPAATAGSWQMELILTDEDDEAVAAAGARVLLGTEPSISLNLNRTIARPLDRVAGAVSLAGGVTPRSVRMIAWMVRPDLTQAGLPNETVAATDLYRGPASDLRWTLFDRIFDSTQQGAYQVHVRLFDDQSGVLLGRASAGFEVCNVSSALSGLVTIDGVAPGASATLAVVRALDLNDRSIAAQSPIANGAYAMTLKPGVYLLEALVTAGTKLVRVPAPAIVRVGCASADLTVNLAGSTSIASSVSGGR
jgi:hypothetical protein